MNKQVNFDEELGNFIDKQQGEENNQEFKKVEEEFIDVLRQQSDYVEEIDSNYKDKDIENNDEVEYKNIEEKEVYNIEAEFKVEDKYLNYFSSIDDVGINSEEEGNEVHVVDEIEEENDEEEKQLRKKKIIKWSIISVSALVLIYLGFSAYFSKRFYFGTSINSIPVSGMTVEAVNEKLAADVEKYNLTLEGRDGVKEEISAAEMGLKFISQDKVQDIKHNQSSFKWITGIFNNSSFELNNIFSYDEPSLREAVDKLAFFDAAKIIEPKSAALKSTEKGYEIVKEVNGNKVNKDTLYGQIVESILSEKSTLDLESIDCYEKPKYTSESKEIVEAMDTLEKYSAITITYTFKEGKETLSGDVINGWLKVDENFNVSIDEDKVESYVDKLGNTYDTVGRPRDFKTTSGRIVKVSGGYYGISINRAKETQDLIRVIKEGKSISKKPIYNQDEEEDNGNGIGGTYVEIDLTNQHMWFYKNGKLMTHGDVVTGNDDGKHSTPPGLYRLTYKQKKAILRGPGYAAPVDFWMPFNGDIGIHDATWRSTFGGTIYKNDGSHGCINTPYDVAQIIFNNIQAGDPVLCYY
ncbi:hypothetical protein J2Z44_002125 [Clostridium punense]|uniref:L,D-TPase catalytic domain-containing protein n=1 Tax=Clostridium punense TaxID=1054297 RepID=A0ABS4K3D8_9CLOT|nr:MULTISPECIES: L,D-transpeptidase family protein [Clostridium]EQB87808.1 hypothetical protein M918_07115 [Clostridium sp. BL8]MBP2022304.1 hypothetical protein [Clostridium punense]